MSMLNKARVLLHLAWSIKKSPWNVTASSDSPRKT